MLPAKKKLPTEDNSHCCDQSASVNHEVQETVEMSAFEPSTRFEEDTCKTPDLERQIAEQSTKIGELEEKLKHAESEINNLCRENIKLTEKLTEFILCRLFHVHFRVFKSWRQLCKHSPRGSVTDIPEDFYNSDSDDEGNVFRLQRKDVAESSSH